MKALLLAALTALPLPARAAAAKDADAKDPSPIQQYYQQALEYYSKQDYRRAIGKWNEILKLDPDQSSARSLLLKARKQVETLTKQRRERTEALVAAGKYEAARLEIQALLDQDPGHPQIVALQSRLESAIKVAAEIDAKSKAERMMVLGAKGWLSYPQDFRLAYDALRYSVELDPKDPRAKAFLDLLLEQRPDLADEAVTPGMKLIPYLQMVAVHQIYDADYHRAVVVLGEVLALEPDDALALKRLGSAYYSLHEKDRARAAWERALRLQPGDATLKKFLSKVGGPRGSAETPDAPASGEKAAQAGDQP